MIMNSEDSVKPKNGYQKCLKSPLFSKLSIFPCHTYRFILACFSSYISCLKEELERIKKVARTFPKKSDFLFKSMKWQEIQEICA